MMEAVFNYLVKHYWDSLVFWRIIGIFLGIVFLGIIIGGWQFRDTLRKLIVQWVNNSDIVAHDRKIFETIDELIPEQKLMSFLDQLQTDDSYNASKVARIYQFDHFYEQTSNHFLTSKLMPSTNEFHYSINKLIEYLGVNFFVYPLHCLDDMKFCLYPALNIDREGDGSPEQRSKYLIYQQKLDILVKDVREKYTVFRKAVKNNLIV